MKQILYLKPSNTDGNFNVWGKAISDFLTAAGCLKNGDAGQVDWSIQHTPSRYTDEFYEMREFVDPLQADVSTFFRIDYTTGFYDYQPGLRIAVGFDTDDQGNLLDPYNNNTFASAIAAGEPSTADGNELRPCVLSAAPNRFALAMFLEEREAFFISLERSKDSSGADTAEGLYFSVYSHTSADYAYTWFIPHNRERPPKTTEPSFLIPNLKHATGSGQKGLAVPFYPPYYFDHGFVKNAGTTHVAYLYNDIPEHTEATLQLYGSDRNFYFLPYTSYISQNSTNGAQAALAMLFE